MPKLLALDQSSKITGVAIFENGKLCKYSKIDVDGELPYRLTEIRNRVKNIITEEGITEVAIEDI
jgi:Holliday junction resolvasome RuvABC endonuclease subunit